jgi:hypothetical protein
MGAREGCGSPHNKGRSFPHFGVRRACAYDVRFGVPSQRDGLINSQARLFGDVWPQPSFELSGPFSRQFRGFHSPSDSHQLRFLPIPRDHGEGHEHRAHDHREQRQ